MNTIKKRMMALVMAGTLGALAAVLAGCEGKDAWSSSPASEPSATTAPAPTPVPTPTPAPTQAPSPTPEATQAPVAVDVEGLFAGNPIDAAEEEAMNNASNGRDVYLALSKSEESWGVFVDNLTHDIASLLSESGTAEDGDEISAFEQEVTTWTQEKDEAVAEILKALDEGGADELEVKNQAADTAVSLYRQRALDLCRKYAELTGQFPDFEAILNAPMG